MDLNFNASNLTIYSYTISSRCCSFDSPTIMSNAFFCAHLEVIKIPIVIFSHQSIPKEKNVPRLKGQRQQISFSHFSFH